MDPWEELFYVIDEKYQLVYYSDKLKQGFPHLTTGKPCYEQLCAKNYVCKNCPAQGSIGTHHIRYNPIVEKWVDVSGSQIIWPVDKKQYTLLVSRFLNDFKGNEEIELAQSSLNKLVSQNSEHYDVDLLTGLYTRLSFYKAVEESIKQSQGEHCLCALDIENFKVFNETFGMEEGDYLLANMGRCLSDFSHHHSMVLGYFGSDDFFFYVENNEDLIRSITSTVTQFLHDYCDNKAVFLPSVGIYRIDDPSLSVSTMCNLAQMAVTSLRGKYNDRICYYNKHLKDNIEKNQARIIEIKRGFKQKEFTFFLQPKCCIQTGKIIGFEALARWNHPTQGLISVGPYIPTFEESGLISELDMFIWEEVAKLLAFWQEQYHKVLPISVNLSLLDIQLIEVVEFFKSLIQKYHINANYLEIEITESVFAKEYHKINDVIFGLKELGFRILIDDFGSGYSSLNMIKNVQADVIKLDMRFLDFSVGDKKGIDILESVIQLANRMNTYLIAEGVENEKQLYYLNKMGCQYAQGFYFYKPLIVDEINQLLTNEENIDYDTMFDHQISYFNNMDLMNERIFNDSLMNHFLGPLVYFETFNDNIKIHKVNDAFCQLINMDVQSLQKIENILTDLICFEHKERMRESILQAKKNKKAKAVVKWAKNNHSGWIIIYISFYKQQDDHSYYYARVIDVSEYENGLK